MDTEILSNPEVLQSTVERLLRGIVASTRDLRILYCVSQKKTCSDFYPQLKINRLNRSEIVPVAMTWKVKIQTIQPVA